MLRLRAPRAVALEEPPALLEHTKTFKYGKGQFEISIAVTEAANGDQRVHLQTDHPSQNLILHWGVQGGKNYKGGWRLPGQRPPQTVQYKERALQTSWQCALLPWCRSSRDLQVLFRTDSGQGARAGRAAVAAR